MKEIFPKTASEHAEDLAAGKYTAEDLANYCLARAEQKKHLNIFLSLNKDSILKEARESDARRKSGKLLSKLDGIPIAIKDNICAIGEKTTCASKILENFVSPYDANVIERLKASGAVLFGRTNLDEFAMGSSTENSSFATTKNPWDPERVPGGSSGGSAAAVAAGIVPLALGSDTGGSIRQPAAFCGIMGLKPTYGSVSRYGLVAFASSLDQIGPFTKSANDASLVLETIAGHDNRDSTSSNEAFQKGNVDLSKLKIGTYLPDDTSSYSKEVLDAMASATKFLKDKGATLVPIKSKYWDYSIPIYYILATAEASSNLSRYDGIRYGLRVPGENLKEVYTRSRTEGFGPEVKRRILLGTFVLSAGYFDAYYGKAQKAKGLIRSEYIELFKGVDFILQPTSPTTAFKIGEKAANPIAMYQSDVLTIAANLGGVPSISIPAGIDGSGMPIGLQLTGAHFSDLKLLEFAGKLAAAPGFTIDYGSQDGKAQSAAPKKVAAPEAKEKITPKKVEKKSAKEPAKKTEKKSKKK